MSKLTIIRRDDTGAAAIEFAIAAPVLVALIWGIFQLACLFWANAGMQNALGAGGRLATLCQGGTSNNQCTVPTPTAVYNAMDAAKFGPRDGTMTVITPTPTAGSGFMDLEVTYTRTMTFLFINGPTISLDRKKRVYTVS
jgi:Flp pilus assembly protein TadG